MEEEGKLIKKSIIWLLSIIALFSVISWLLYTIGNSAETAIIRYEEFQEMYNTCEKLNTDIGILRETPDDDKQFEQFSKAQRINQLKHNLNRWIQEYNAKSKMWNRALWKSRSLPYQLDINQFPNYKN